MKNMLKCLVLALLVAGFTGCKDEKELLTTDVGPEMKVLSYDAAAVFGGAIRFEASLNDPLPLSTLKAQVYFDDELVAETVIRTKTNGTYDGSVILPFYKNISNGNATLVILGQNTHFGLTRIEQTVSVTRPDTDHLIYVMGDQEFRMERTGLYEYAVTDVFPQKPKGYIRTPELDADGNFVTFGYADGGIVAGSVDTIPFSNSNAGEYTITFNTLSFEGSPFTKLLFNGTEMTMLDNDNYFIVTTLTQNSEYELEGITDFENWNVDMDYFERTPDGKIKFLPMNGMYKVTANFEFSYLKIEAMKSATELATLNEDGTGAVWVIGDMSIGKPTMKNGASWSPEKGGLCLAPVAKGKYQLTLVAGISLNATKFDFKFFHQKTWGGEFGGKDISTTSDLVQVTESGNLALVEGKTFELGGVYRFSVDLTAGNTSAKLTVEKVGDQPLPPADISINDTKMTQVDADNYTVDLDLTQGGAVTMSGDDAFVPEWMDTNYFALNGSAVSFIPVSGHYRIKVNLADKFIRCQRINADGSDVTTADNGEGGLWLMGWGMGAPSMDYQFGFNPGAAYCMAEVSPAIYVLTGKAGPETDSVFGQYIRIDYISVKYFFQNGWGGEMSNPSFAPGTEALLKVDGNLGLQDGVTLEENATYEFKVDLTAGKENGVISFVKK